MVNEMPNGGPGMGMQRRGVPPDACICPKCKKEYPKTRGVPCRSQTCPDCNIPLMGK
ncbi:MAG TPA: hypothetical protein PKM87_01135 [Methanolinea sp.]|nr:hypothetical protein [Methanolinea sp.]